MDIETTRTFFAWCTVFNWGLLFVWWAGYSLGGDWVRNLHGKWFGLSKEAFDTVIYSAMVVYKALVFFFNLVPYLVLRLFF